MVGSAAGMAESSVFGAASMLPFIRITLEGEFAAFEVIVTDLFIGPIRLLSYFTRITFDSPGAIGSRGHSGTVQPQVDFALLIINGAFPVFLNLKACVTIAPSSIF